MTIAQIYHVYSIFVALDNVWQIIEILVRKQRLQVCSMRIVARILNFLGLIRLICRPIDYKNTRLIPNTAYKGPSGQQTHLCHIFASENFIFAQGELLIFKSRKVHPIATAKTETIIFL